MVEFSENHGQKPDRDDELSLFGIKDTADPSSRACHQPKSVYSNIP